MDYTFVRPACLSISQVVLDSAIGTIWLRAVDVGAYVLCAKTGKPALVLMRWQSLRLDMGRVALMFEDAQVAVWEVSAAGQGWDRSAVLYPIVGQPIASAYIVRQTDLLRQMQLESSAGNNKLLVEMQKLAHMAAQDHVRVDRGMRSIEKQLERLYVIAAGDMPPEVLAQPAEHGKSGVALGHRAQSRQVEQGADDLLSETAKYCAQAADPAVRASDAFIGSIVIEGNPKDQRKDRQKSQTYVVSDYFELVERAIDLLRTEIVGLADVPMNGDYAESNWVETPIRGFDDDTTPAAEALHAADAADVTGTGDTSNTGDNATAARRRFVEESAGTLAQASCSTNIPANQLIGGARPVAEAGRDANQRAEQSGGFFSPAVRVAARRAGVEACLAEYGRSVGRSGVVE